MKVPPVLIMAAGRGTRMRSSLPKVLHPLCGRPLLLWPVEAARAAGADGVVVVLGPESDDIRRLLPPSVDVALQPEPRGTGDAVTSARDRIEGAGDVIVLPGDHPLLDATFVERLAESHLESGAAATVVTQVVDEPGEYGRIVRGSDGEIERIVEAKTPGDASAAELAIKEVNTCIYAFKTGPLLEALGKVGADNAQGEIYLGDVLPLLRSAGHGVRAYLSEGGDAGFGINTRADLAAAHERCQRRILERHMLAGVTITDPASTLIDVEVKIGEDSLIDPYTFLRGQVEIGAACRVGPMTTLTDCVLGEGVSVLHSYLDGCEVLDGCTVGPFAYIRPGSRLGEGSKAGTFVEIKNSEIGEGVKVPHLSYIGDADVGDGSNIGAGNITANYDGRRKHRTVIGKNVHTGVDTSFVAPVTVGDDAYTGAGSVITSDVPEGSLGIARAPQQNMEGYAEQAAGGDGSKEPEQAPEEPPKAASRKGDAARD